MTDSTVEAEQSPEAKARSAFDPGDRKADAWAVVVIFTAAILMAITYVSGFSFDFG